MDEILLNRDEEKQVLALLKLARHARARLMEYEHALAAVLGKSHEDFSRMHLAAGVWDDEAPKPIMERDNIHIIKGHSYALKVKL